MTSSSSTTSSAASANRQLFTPQRHKLTVLEDTSSPRLWWAHGRSVCGMSPLPISDLWEKRRRERLCEEREAFAQLEAKAQTLLNDTLELTVRQSEEEAAAAHDEKARLQAARAAAERAEAGEWAVTNQGMAHGEEEERSFW